MRGAKTETIVAALRVLADAIISDGGMASDAIRQAAARLDELQDEANRNNTQRAERDRLGERIARLRALCRCAADWLIEAGQTDRAEMLLDMSRQLDPHHD